jgi:hypothetical protein
MVIFDVSQFKSSGLSPYISPLLMPPQNMASHKFKDMALCYFGHFQGKQRVPLNIPVIFLAV